MLRRKVLRQSLLMCAYSLPLAVVALIASWAAR
jgi:hypothetical protein